jgi:hypothetical protein
MAWTEEELNAYNIVIDEKEFLEEMISGVDYIHDADPDSEGDVEDLARGLLKHLGFDKSSRLLRTGRCIPLGTSSKVQIPICIINRKTGSILLVQEIKRQHNPIDPEPQVIAEAIATFQYNKHTNSSVIPCIIMVGTFPRFYLVPVTKELSECVATGQRPRNTTRVLKHTPKVSKKNMKSVDSRRKILQCYESFKKFVDELEELI